VVSLWTILNKLPIWGKLKSTIGETFSLLTAIKNREVIQSYDEYNENIIICICGDKLNILLCDINERHFDYHSNNLSLNLNLYM